MTPGSAPPEAETPRYAKLGAELRWLRLSRGWSLRALARRVGLTAHSGLVDYERGHRLLPDDLLAGYERAFGADAARLRSLRDAALLARAGAAAERPEPVAGPPAELPTDLADFVGREAELDQLLAAAGTATGAVRVLAISGMPGSGKTSLAVHLAHRLRPEYPDGQIWLDLHGAGQAAVAPAAAQRRVLRAAGVPDSMFPADPEELAGLYRSTLAERRMLLVLDDAAGEAQVRPLVPGSPTTLVLVTSRNPVPALDGAARCPLDVLAPADAAVLVERIVGTERARAEPDATAAIARWCGGLPLAIRVGASRLATWPDWSLAECAAALAQEHERLAWLEFGDRAVRGAFEMSCRALTEPARVLFRRLALLPGPEFGGATAAALLESTEPAVARPLAEIINVGLLSWGARPGRYRMHDLIRWYAHEELIAAEDAATRRPAEVRALTCLLATARQAATQLDRSGVVDSQLVGEFDTDPPATWPAGEAVRWLDTERAALSAAVRRAGELDLSRLVFALLPALSWFYDLRCLWEDQRQLGETALRLAEAHRDRTQEMIACNAVALAELESGRPSAAADWCRRAIAVAQRINDAEGESWARDRLGLALCGLGRHDEAIGELRRAALLAHECGAWWEEAAALNHLGFVHETNNQPELAAASYRRAAAAFRLFGDDRGDAMARVGLGRSLCRSGHPAEAVQQHERAMALFDAADDQWGEAMARYHLALARRALGDTTTVTDLLTRAAAAFGRHGDRRRQAEVLRALA